MEVIKSIEKFEVDDNSGWACGMYGGYKITTSEQVISLEIDTYQNCCENAGYFMSEDDVQSFVGSKLLGLKITDTELKEGLLKEHDLGGECFEGGIMFVDIETSNGTLQFVAYNEHNGYYGHEARVLAKSLEHHEWL